MTATSLDAVLDQFDTALAARPIQYQPLMDAFRSLEIPTGVTDAQLSRVLSVCCRVLGGDANPMDRDRYSNRAITSRPAPSTRPCAS